MVSCRMGAWRISRVSAWGACLPRAVSGRPLLPRIRAYLDIGGLLGERPANKRAGGGGLVRNAQLGLAERRSPPRSIAPALGPQVVASATNPDVLSANLAAAVSDRAHEVPGDALVEHRADLLIGREDVGVLRHDGLPAIRWAEQGEGRGR
jgi:hypothetical protein